MASSDGADADAPSWTPLLTGTAADAARGVVREIARELVALPEADAEAADISLLLAYAATSLDEPWLNEQLERWLEILLGSPQRQGLGLALHGGLAGAGFALAHLTAGGAEDLLSGIDRILLDELTHPTPLGGDYDLICGVVGLGVYFLERQHEAPEVAAVGLERVVATLAARAEARPDGLTWFSPPAHLRAKSPERRYDCGLAHGVPGVIALLGRIIGAGVGGDRAHALLADAVRWMWARSGAEPTGRFPYDVDDRDQPGAAARTAWCYGDPGVAVALWSAAVAVDADTRRAQALALEVAARPPGRSQVRDAGLCHGAMGLAHLCNRYFQASGEDRFRDAACAWIEHGLALRQRGQAIAGFPAFRAPDDPFPAASPGVLDGAAGVGLALLASISEQPPDWDRVLLCDLPPRPR